MLSSSTLPLLERVLFILFSTYTSSFVQSHGFLSTPRSRNLVAFEDRKYYPITESDPLPEDCPNCLNRGGVLARCGVMNPSNDERNYDLPKNALGLPMHPNPQATYSESQIIDLEVTLTAHHKGHFVFKACPVNSTFVSPSQECFDAHPLEFVKDLLYHAPIDKSHPERVYVAPITIPNKVFSQKVGFEDAMIFQYQFRLPPGVFGDLVLIQWYYVASNSGCIHEGYDSYEFPQDWIATSSTSGENDDGESPSAWEEKFSVGTGLKPCNDILSEDGNGIPEQFWNCAEVTIQPKSVLLADQNSGSLSSSVLPSKTIIGYYASWQWYDREKLAAPLNMDFSKVSRVNFAFFQTDTEGNLWGTDSWADPNLLFGPYNWNPSPEDKEYCSWDMPREKVCNTHFFEEGLIHLVHAAGAEIYPSLGGWSLSDPFPAMAANSEARLNFAKKCVEIIEDYDFDGIDIDWEYPGYTDHSGTPEDTVNYNLLLEIVREKLDELGTRTGRFYGLTAALPCGPSNINNIDIKTAAAYLTELNLMTYDFFGAWSTVTGANAPLYDQNWGGDDAKDYSVDGCVRNWIKGGASPSAINIGLPFYGRSFLSAKGLNESHDGNDKNTWFLDDGSPQYYHIIEKLPGMVSVRHELTKTQFAYQNTTTGGLVSFDDEEAICDKTEYCLQNDLNGFIIWELSGDVMSDLTTPLLDAVHSKLNNPSLPCKSLAYESGTFSESANETLAASNGGVSISPTSDLSTASPTSSLSCPDAHNFPMPHDNCKAYFYCVNGNPIHPILPCPDGTLFDETSMLCLPSGSVTCSLSSNPTVQSTEKPSVQQWMSIIPAVNLIESIQNASDSTKHQQQHLVPITSVPTTTLILTAPMPGNIVVQDSAHNDNFSSIQSPSPAITLKDQIISQEQDTLIPSSAFCEGNFSGARPFKNCTEYYYCFFGKPLFPAISCPRGKLFVEDLTVDNLITCVDENLVVCPNSSSVSVPIILVAEHSNSPHSGTSSPNKLDFHLSLKFSNSPSAQVQTLMNSPSLSPFSEVGLGSTSFSPEKLPATGDSSFCFTCLSGYTGFVASSNDCSVYCLCENGVLDQFLFACPSDWLFDKNQLQCLPMEKVHCNNTMVLATSVSIVDSNNGVNAQDATNASLQEPNLSSEEESSTQFFSLDGPFITLEFKFNDRPDDIGWSLLSSDGVLDFSKPPGTYSDFNSASVVFEAISLRSISAQQELIVTVTNVRGTGLCCSNEGEGYFKIFSGQPEEINFLVEGGDFGYYDTIHLLLTDDGVIYQMKEHSSTSAGALPSMIMDTYGTSNETKKDEISEGGQINMSNESIIEQQKPEALHAMDLDSVPPQTTIEDSNTIKTNLNDSSQINNNSPKDLKQSEAIQDNKNLGDNKAFLISILIAVVVISFFLGSTLLFIATRRREPTSAKVLFNFDDNDEELLNDPICSWNSNEFYENQSLKTEVETIQESPAQNCCSQNRNSDQVTFSESCGQDRQYNEKESKYEHFLSQCSDNEEVNPCISDSNNSSIKEFWGKIKITDQKVVSNENVLLDSDAGHLTVVSEPAIVDQSSLQNKDTDDVLSLFDDGSVASFLNNVDSFPLELNNEKSVDGWNGTLT